MRKKAFINALCMVVLVTTIVYGSSDSDLATICLRNGSTMTNQAQLATTSLMLHCGACGKCSNPSDIVSRVG